MSAKKQAVCWQCQQSNNRQLHSPREWKDPSSTSGFPSRASLSSVDSPILTKSDSGRESGEKSPSWVSIKRFSGTTEHHWMKVNATDACVQERTLVKESAVHHPNDHNCAKYLSCKHGKNVAVSNLTFCSKKSKSITTQQRNVEILWASADDNFMISTENWEWNLTLAFSYRYQKEKSLEGCGVYLPQINQEGLNILCTHQVNSDLWWWVKFEWWVTLIYAVFSAEFRRTKDKISMKYWVLILLLSKTNFANHQRCTEASLSSSSFVQRVGSFAIRRWVSSVIETWQPHAIWLFSANGLQFQDKSSDAHHGHERWLEEISETTSSKRFGCRSEAPWLLPADFMVASWWYLLSAPSRRYRC